MDRIRVLVVDDSAFMRHSLTRLLSEAPSIEIVGSAANGEQGLAMAASLSPDVITLDVEMPILDGVGMLIRLMREKPTRVVMLSSITTEGAQVTLDSLDLGAIDFVSKPSGSLSIDIGRVGAELVTKIQAAASMSEARFLRHRQIAALNAAARAARLRAAGQGPAAGPAGLAGSAGMHSGAGVIPGQPNGRIGLPPGVRAPGPLGTAATPSPWASRPARPARPEPKNGLRIAARKLVVIASSTGGPGALNTLVRGLPDHLGAAVAIVQHMPPGFTASLADRLDSISAIPAAEAAAEDLLEADQILIAPGDKHLIASTTGRIQLVNLPPVNGVRPAADVTLQAVAPLYRDRLLCVVLTGMGCDGREGARSVKQHGGTVFAQDEATSTIYGMPAAVAEAGLADLVLPLPEIASAIARWCASGPSERPSANETSPSAGQSIASPPPPSLESSRTFGPIATHARLDRADT